MAKKKELVLGVIIGLVVGLLLGATASYLILNKTRPNLRNFQSFQMNDSVKSSIISFFNSTSDSNQIQSYCQQNRMYCAYYCRAINPSNEICSQLSSFARGAQ